MKSDVEYMLKAYEVASRSHHPRTQTGAVLVTIDGKEAMANNRIPSSLYTPERLAEKSLRDDYMEHAERNAIFYAAGRGLYLLGATMYSPWAPCVKCARALIISNFVRLVVHRDLMDRTPDRWAASVKRGLEMVQESDITVQYLEGYLGAEKIRFDGSILEL